MSNKIFFTFMLLLLSLAMIHPVHEVHARNQLPNIIISEAVFLDEINLQISVQNIGSQSIGEGEPIKIVYNSEPVNEDIFHSVTKIILDRDLNPGDTINTVVADFDPENFGNLLLADYKNVIHESTEYESGHGDANIAGDIDYSMNHTYDAFGNPVLDELSIREVLGLDSFFQSTQRTEKQFDDQHRLILSETRCDSLADLYL